MKRLLLLSGPMASGKSTISAALQKHYGFLPISSGAFLRAQFTARDEPFDRYKLQELGDSLDRATDFSWLIESVARPIIDAHLHIDNWLLDAVRKPRQVELFRLYFGKTVVHVHIDAKDSILQQRYAERGSNKPVEYSVSVAHPNELCARSLVGIADKVFDTEKYSAVEIAHQIMEFWE